MCSSILTPILMTRCSTTSSLTPTWSATTRRPESSLMPCSIAPEHQPHTARTRGAVEEQSRNNRGTIESIARAPGLQVACNWPSACQAVYSKDVFRVTGEPERKRIRHLRGRFSFGEAILQFDYYRCNGRAERNAHTLGLSRRGELQT